jgi:spore maturation protein SpmA
MHFDVLFRAGLFFIITFGDPGVHGAVVTGIQGCGVSTPAAAVVAEATIGFDRVVHMIKGMILLIGMLSMIVAAGFISALTILVGKTKKELGPVPNEHCNIAPIATS